jgi:hypothetical protein
MPDQAHYSSTDRLRLAMVSLVDKGNLAALGFKTGASALVYGIPWSGELDAWDNDKADYLSSYEYESSEDKSWLYVSTHLSAAGAQALIDCLRKREADARLYLTVAKIDDTSAYLTVTAGSKGWGGGARLVEITAREGAQLLAKTKLSVPANGSQSVTLARNRYADLTVTANVDSVPGDQITIPAEPYLKSCSIPIESEARAVPEGSAMNFICPMMRVGKRYTVEVSGKVQGDVAADPADGAKKLNVELGLVSAGFGRSWLPKAGLPAARPGMPFSLTLDDPGLTVRTESVAVTLSLRQCNVASSAMHACVFAEGSLVEIRVNP